MSGIDDRLNGKVAVITGASRGIGKQAALRLAKYGAKVVIAARTVEPRANTPGTLGDTAAELRALGCDPLVLPADLSRQEDLDRLVAATFERCDGVDILINNAAYTVGKALFSQVPELTRDQWEKGFAINVTAPLMLMTAFWESMRQRRGGLVLNVTSPVADLQPLGVTNGLTGQLTAGQRTAVRGEQGSAGPHGQRGRGRRRAAHIAVIGLVPGHVLTETMDETYRQQGIVGAETGAIPLAVPAAAIEYLCTIEDPMRYSGQIVRAPELVAELGIATS